MLICRLRKCFGAKFPHLSKIVKVLTLPIILNLNLISKRILIVIKMDESSFVLGHLMNKSGVNQVENQLSVEGQPD